MNLRRISTNLRARLRWALKQPRIRSEQWGRAAREYRRRWEATPLAVDVLGAFSRLSGRPAADRLPLPPSDLMLRVTGSTDPNWFLASGKQTHGDFADALAAHGKSYADFRGILDFGCGCGRVLRWLRQEIPAERLSGSDIDEAAVKWLRWNMPGVDVRINGSLPPLRFADNSFDLVLSYSVFSHLDEAYQDSWLAELARIAQPGALLLLTVHGRCNWASIRDDVWKDPSRIANLDVQLESNGFLYTKEDAWNRYFPDFYHTAWHTPDYIRRHWSRWFEVLDVREAEARPTQDLVILRKQ